MGEYQFSTAALTLQEQIWLHRLRKDGDPEMLLEIMLSRLRGDVTRHELLHMNGDLMSALVERLVQSVADVASGKVLVDRFGLQ
jgi:hypothetical protein